MKETGNNIFAGDPYGVSRVEHEELRTDFGVPETELSAADQQSIIEMYAAIARREAIRTSSETDSEVFRRENNHGR